MEERREFSMETHLALLDFGKAFYMVKRPLLFKILKKINIPKLLLQNMVKLYKSTEIKIKANNKLSYTKQINTGVRRGCPLSPTLFNVYINES
jgi:hypothetical protein